MGLPTLLKKGSLLPGMGESKKDLDQIKPIDYILQWFRKKRNTTPKTMSDRVVVALSTTGTGKSTTLPAELYLHIFKKENMIVTQPRIVTAIDIPKTIVNIPAYKEIVMGKNIGYKTGDFSNKPDKKGILFTTVGVLLFKLKNSKPEFFAKQFSCVILDEAHERSVELDMVFFYLKEMSKVVPLAKMPFIICASGTMDIELYKKYFDTSTVFIIQGDSYPIIDNYLPYDSDNLLKSVEQQLVTIHGRKDDAYKSDIVLFVPTKSLAIKIAAIADTAPGLEGLTPIVVDSASLKQVADVYVKVFDKIDTLKGTRRKLIIGTNSIETGITLESITYCIDTGLVNSMEYNPVYRTGVLVMRPVTQAMALQRRGRVGRIQEGEFFPMYSKDTFQSMFVIQMPVMVISDLSKMVLAIVYSKNTDLANLDTMNKVPSISLTNSMNKLISLNLITKDLVVTNLGVQVNRFKQLPLEAAVMLLSMPWSSEMITIATLLMLGKSSIIDTRFKRKSSEFGCEWLDFLILFEELTTLNLNEVKKFCENNGILYSALSDFMVARGGLILDTFAITKINFRRVGFAEKYHLHKQRPYGSGFPEMLQEFKTCFFKGFKSNTMVVRKPNLARMVYTGVEVFVPGAAIGDIMVCDGLLVKKGMNGKFSVTIPNGVCLLDDVPITVNESHN